MRCSIRVRIAALLLHLTQAHTYIDTAIFGGGAGIHQDLNLIKHKS